MNLVISFKLTLICFSYIFWYKMFSQDRKNSKHFTANFSFIPGITNFDLLGEYGRLDSLHNFYMVLAYNAIFGVATASCLVNKFTASVRNYIVNNVRVYVYKMRKTTKLKPAWKAVNVVATANGSAAVSKND